MNEDQIVVFFYLLLFAYSTGKRVPKDELVCGNENNWKNQVLYAATPGQNLRVDNRLFGQ
jgi:5-methylcytosine-specific restriction endonuclease McrA